MLFMYIILTPDSIPQLGGRVGGKYSEINSLKIKKNKKVILCRAGLGNARAIYCNFNSGGSELQGIAKLLSP
jgi:hypothetical protein